MISYVLELPFQATLNGNKSNIDRSLGELYILLFSIELSKLIKSGLIKSYHDEENELLTVRGKINLSRTIDLRCKGKHTIDCIYDEYSADEYLNRIIKSVASQLIFSNISIEPIELKRSLRQNISIMSNIAQISLKNISWETITFNQYNKQYKTIILLCELIVESLLLISENESNNFKAIEEKLFHKLFERFIRTFFRKTDFETNVSDLKMKWNSNDTYDFIPKMHTDTTITYLNKTLIIDTKFYKEIFGNNRNSKKFRSGHLYQIFSYVVNYKIQHSNQKVAGLLLYAATKLSLEKYRFPYNYSLGNVPISIDIINLSVEPPEIEEQLKQIYIRYFNDDSIF
jgi:5-methylcytosine-specific restriction enzyme subunit mcrC